MNWRKRKKLRRIAQHHGYKHWHSFNQYTKLSRMYYKNYNDIKMSIDYDGDVAIVATDVPREMIHRTHEICEKIEEEIEKGVYEPVANLALHLTKQTIRCINKEDIPVEPVTWTEQDTKDMARSVMKGLFTPYLVEEGESPDNIIDSMTDDQVLELAEAVASGMQKSLESRNTNDSINIKI